MISVSLRLLVLLIKYSAFLNDWGCEIISFGALVNPLPDLIILNSDTVPLPVSIIGVIAACCPTPSISTEIGTSSLYPVGKVIVHA